MIWAILDENNRVTSIVEQEEKPEHSVKALPGTGYAIGKLFNGWTFNGPTYTSYQFLTRFTPEERAAIRALALTDSTVADFLQLEQAAQEIITDNPIVVSGMDYLVSVGLLTESRKNEIIG